ncbi:hypothetical protein HK101_003297 [Irineochytrium annulatum]|nr:hypothetical protein HK101_003297 [Irineochytrium annulatum]
MTEQQDRYLKEIKALKQRMEVLEKENIALKKSIYDLSHRYNAMATSRTVLPFRLDGIDPAFDLAELDHPLQGPDLGAKLTPASSGGEAQPPVLGTQNPVAAALADTSGGGLIGGKLGRGSTREAKNFYLKYELKGHIGAVYAIQFSPCGKYLASGSFDKTVRVWDAVSAASTEIQTLKKHSSNVADVAWSNNSAELLTGSYDMTCKVWDVEGAKVVDSFDSADGFVQAVEFNPADNKIFYYGTSRDILGVIDRRMPEAAMSIVNDAKINTISSFKDGIHVVSGDTLGCLKIWDVRTGKCVSSFQNEPTKKPISHIATCSMGSDEDEPRYMAVNSYDNLLRVYDRGLSPPQTQQRLVQTFKGFKNKNYPIKSSFFRSKDAATIAPIKRSSSNDGGIYMDDVLPHDGADPDKDKASDSGILLATGSSDPFVYIYSLGSQEGSGELLQRLEGHTDMVCATTFHPVEPILASSSADFSIKVWFSNGKRKKIS